MGKSLLCKLGEGKAHVEFPLLLFLYPTDSEYFPKACVFSFGDGLVMTTPPSHSWDQLQFLWWVGVYDLSCLISTWVIVKWLWVSWEEGKHGTSGTIPRINLSWHRSESSLLLWPRMTWCWRLIFLFNLFLCAYWVHLPKDSIPKHSLYANEIPCHHSPCDSEPVAKKDNLMF